LSEQLQRKLRHLQLASRPDIQIGEYEKYLCIQTALHTPEFEAIRRLSWDWKPLDQGVDGTIYYSGTLLKKGQAQPVVAACAPRMGIAAAAALASKMIYTFRPRYLAMAGIAAGIRTECEIGDVILADPVWDWGSGKIISQEGGQRFHQAPHQISTNSFVRGKGALMAGDGASLDEIRRGWSGPKPGNALRMHVRPMASGAAVLADTSTFSELKAQHRKLTGIDMEAYGVYSAAEEASLPQPSVFAIKSVCDFADERKNDDYQAYAAYTSAEALRIFVERFL
jgi:nucleoside phosphorylase